VIDGAHQWSDVAHAGALETEGCGADHVFRSFDVRKGRRPLEGVEVANK
jgi:hypothetical protein